MPSGRRVAITGGTGHLGVNLVRACAARGDTVRVLVRGGDEHLRGVDCELVQGDIADEGVVERCFQGAEVVLHAAALISIDGDQGGEVQRVNVRGAQVAARAAVRAGARRFVHVASVHAMEMWPRGGVIDESRARVEDPGAPAYDRSKAAGEAAVRSIAAEGLDVVIVHPTGIIGPADVRPSRMGRFFLDLYHGKLPALVEGGFDWVDVRDVVTAMLAAAEVGRSGESYLIGNASASMRRLAEIAAAETGRPAPRFSSPQWLARVGAPIMKAYERATGAEPLYTSEALHAVAADPQVSHRKAREELGHRPRPHEESIRDLYAWFRERGMLRA